MTRPRALLAFICALAASSSSLHAQTLTLSRTDYASSAGARGAAMADFDRNGWPDIAHANTGRDTVTVLLNKGAGVEDFTRAFDVAVGHGPFDMVAADFNGDRQADLAVANADGNSISVLLGRGDGSFARTDIAAPGNPRAVSTADVNRDGKADLVYTAFAINRVQVLLGNGAGGFTAGTSITGIAQRPQGLAPADFNKDGRVDFAVTYASPGGLLAIFSATASGGFTVQTVPGEDNLNVVTTGDFNDDGWIDVAAASTGNSRLAVYLGSATGMRQVATAQTGASPRGITAADVTHDGRLDVITANKESSTINVFVARADAPGAFASSEFASGAGSRAVVTADFNHDGHLDIATANQDAATATVLWNDTRLVRTGFSYTLPPDTTFDDVAGDITIVVDLNHNGKLDRVVSEGRIIFDTGANVRLPGECGLPAVADLNADGHVDIACLNLRELVLFVGNGTGGFAASRTVASWASPTIVQDFALGDLNRDGRLDLLVATYEVRSLVGTLHVLSGRGDGTFAPPATMTLPAATFHIVIGDLDQDGRDDLLGTPFRGVSATNFYVLIGNGQGGFSRTDEYVLPEAMGDFELADLNEDGRLDVAGATFDSLLILTGTGGGRLSEPLRYVTGDYRVSIGDVTGDGHLDIVSNRLVDVWAGSGDGTFAPPQTFAPIGFNPVVADMNRDGVLDIVLGSTDGIMFGQRNETNRSPVADAGPDLRVSYHDVFNDDDEDSIFIGLDAHPFDPDLHSLTYEWRDAAGTVIGTNQIIRVPQLLPGSYALSLRVFDGRGGTAEDQMTLTIDPIPEIVLHGVPSLNNGSWQHVVDSTAASGVRAFDPDRGAAKVVAPLAEPANSIEMFFVADPTQEYKLWIRGRAQNDFWGNDSAWVQFDRSLDASGKPAYRIGTTSALPFNLEECSGCGISGWGWEDDGWGAVNANGTTIRFEGGPQRIRIQTREDGISIDQVVLSAVTYKTTRPGKAKNDTTILPRRVR